VKKKNLSLLAPLLAPSAAKVRIMPEILYANFPASVITKACPRYDWAYLKRIGMLDNINMIVRPTRRL